MILCHPRHFPQLLANLRVYLAFYLIAHCRSCPLLRFCAACILGRARAGSKHILFKSYDYALGHGQLSTRIKIRASGHVEDCYCCSIQEPQNESLTSEERARYGWCIRCTHERQTDDLDRQPAGTTYG